MIKTIKDISSDQKLTADVVVIGSGAGAAPMACNLAEAGLKVIMVEEGSYVPVENIVPDMTWALRNLYRNQGMQAVQDDLIIPVPTGRVVGGTTYVNCCICWWLPEFVLDEWQKDMGLEFDRERLFACFDYLDKYLRIGPARDEVKNQQDVLMVEAAKKLGWEHQYMNLNSPDCEGCCVCPTGCPAGGKTSMDQTFIPRAMKAGADLYANCHATQIKVVGGKATGISGVFTDPATDEAKYRFDIEAKVVVLAGGAVADPILLLKNGIANSSGQVGENLHLHAGVGVIGYNEGRSIKPWYGSSQGFAVTEFHNEGMMIESVTFPIEGWYPMFPSFGKEAMELAKKIENMYAAGMMLRDRSTGSVKPKGDSWQADMKWELIDEDFQKYVRAIGLISELFFAGGADWVLPQASGMGLCKSLDEVKAKAAKLTKKHMTLYASHPQGTARMHGDPKKGVLKNTGETYDVENLWIADASIFPTAVGVNPQQTIMSFSMYFSKFVAERAGATASDNPWASPVTSTTE